MPLSRSTASLEISCALPMTRSVCSTQFIDDSRFITRMMNITALAIPTAKGNTMLRRKIRLKLF